MILIIDNYDSFTYNLYQIVAKHRETLVVRNDKISLEQIRQMGPKGIILSPGPGHPETSGICLEILRELAPEIPILGVCLGHQAIALVFGGKVVQAPEIVHGKTSEVFHRRQHLFAALPLPMTAGRYHSLIVEELPEELEVEAESGDGLIMAIKHKRFPLFGVQFHPESILTPEGEALIEAFLRVAQ